MTLDAALTIPVPKDGYAARRHRRAWPLALAACIVSILWIIAWYGSTGLAMVSIWARSDTFAHGFIVLPIALWLVWRVRARIAAVTPHPSWWVLAPIAAAGFAWLMGELAAVNAVSQSAFTALLVLTVPAVLGTRVARVIAFPLGFMFFAVPIGEFLMPQLMSWTADFTVLALTLTGIPVYREGLQFVIPSGYWSVAEACSGVRYLIASLMVGTLYAYLVYRSPRRRLVFVGVSILVPIVANWLRAYMIVMIGHLSGNKLAVGVDHLIYGWLFFGIVMLMMFWVGGRWRDDEARSAELAEPVLASARAASPSHIFLAAALVTATTMVWPLGYRWMESRDVAAPAQLSTVSAAADWRATPAAPTAWAPRFQGPSAELHEAFRRGDQTVGLYIGYYRNQSYRRKLVSSDNVLVTSNNPLWARVGSGMHSISLAGQSADAQTAELRGPLGERLITWQWYWIGGRLTASDPLAKAYTALSRLMGEGDDGAVVIVYAAKEQAGGGQAAMEAFLHDAAPVISATLEHAKLQR